MNILYLIIFFIFGTLMGSFLTVIGLRLPKKENFTTQSKLVTIDFTKKISRKRSIMLQSTPMSLWVKTYCR